MNKIKISDRTILIKSQGNEATLSFKEKVEIARLLESANVDVVEFPAIENEKQLFEIKIELKKYSNLKYQRILKKYFRPNSKKSEYPVKML